jgi:protein TonB
MAEAGGRGTDREELTMAFEAFRAQSEAPARSGRRSLWYAISVAFHGALIVVGIAYSFWHIEELSPPLLKVTFLSAAPPPPPAPPPPAGGGAAKKKVTIKPKLVVQKPEIVQPKEIPKEAPKEAPKAEDHGEKDGVKGGTIGGTAGGTIGGTMGGVVGAPPAAPKFLPPNMAKQQLLSGPEPDFPPSLNHGGNIYRVLVKICVSTAGGVDKVMLMKGADSLLDENVLSKVKTWRFRPLLANNVAVPFCYPATFEFKSHP